LRTLKDASLKKLISNNPETLENAREARIQFINGHEI
jgi:hypothetical protein